MPDDIEIVTPKQLQALLKGEKRPKRNKYHNQKVTIDGHKFDSIAEGNRYLVLKDMLDRGEITNLKLQPPFVLFKSFKYQGRLIRQIKYIADFMYIEVSSDLIVVEDVKGKVLPVFRLKEHLFLRQYGDQYDFRVIPVTYERKSRRKA